MLDTEHKKLINSTISIWRLPGLSWGTTCPRTYTKILYSGIVSKRFSKGTLPDTHSPWEPLLLHALPVSFWMKALHGHSLTPPHDPLWGLQQSHELMFPPLKRKLELGLLVAPILTWKLQISHWALNGFGRWSVCYPPWREYPPLQFHQKIYRKGKERALILLDY